MGSAAEGGDRREVALVTGAALAFATSGPLAKVAVGIAPVTVAAARTAIAALVLFALDPRGTARQWRALSPRSKRRVGVAGALLAGHFALFLAGLDRTSLASAVALISLEPIAVVVAAFLAFGLRPTRRDGIGLVLAIAGAIAISAGRDGAGHSLVGDALVVGAAALYGGYVASARILRDELAPRPFATAVYGVSALVLAPFALACSWGARAPDSGAVFAVVALGLVPTLLGHTMMQSAARTASPALVALVAPGETIGAIAIGAVALKSAPTPRELVGAALVLVGGALALTARRYPVVKR